MRTNVCLAAALLSGAFLQAQSQNPPPREPEVKRKAYVRRVSVGATLSVLGFTLMPNHTVNTVTTNPVVDTLYTTTDAPRRIGYGLTTEVWWSPSHPFKSSLNGMSAKALAEIAPDAPMTAIISPRLISSLQPRRTMYISISVVAPLPLITNRTWSPRLACSWACIGSARRSSTAASLQATPSIIGRRWRR